MKRLGVVAVLLACGAYGSLLYAQARPAITGIAFFQGYAADLDASAKLYSGDMGFARTKAGADDVYSVNASQWFQMTPLKGEEHASRMAAVGFTTRDVKGLSAYLTAHGQTVIPMPEPGRIGVNDPEGNLVVFVQAGSGHPGSNEPAPKATSHRIIHVGFVVKSAEAEDKFYRQLLGFKPYWHGGQTDARTDYVSLQVPDGTDWLEYMLNNTRTDLRQIGVMDHFSLGTAKMDTVVAQLAANGCTDANCKKTQHGRDGKIQLNLFDPDLTRIEYMEFKPVDTPCCSAFTGKHPSEVEEQ